MNLAAMDLNLLVTFEALLAERNVTRAGQRIGLGQPAMSAALGRLRHIFQDELLVRVPGGPMRPTPKAAALNGPIAEALARIRQLFDMDAGFDPSEARAVLRIATSDHPATMILPQFIERLARLAPKIDVRIVALDKRNGFDRLDRGEIDFLLGWFRNPPKRIRHQPMYSDRSVCVIRRGHPLLSSTEALTLDAYTAAPHVLMTLNADDRGIADEVLGRMGRKRRVAVTVTDFHLVPRIIERTDMIGHLPSRMAPELTRGFDLVLTPPPVELPAWDVELFWGGESDAEPASRWLRALLFEIGREIEPPAGT